MEQKPVVLEKTDESSWKISSFTNLKKTYDIVKGQTCELCKIKCYDCSEHICTHSLRCTCAENSIKDIMCKHIHYLLLTTPFNEIENSLFEIEEVQLQAVDDGLEYLEEVTSYEDSQLPAPSSGSNEYRGSLINSIIEEYSQIVAKAKNEEQLQFLRSELKKISATINAMASPTVPEKPRCSLQIIERKHFY